MAKIGKVRPLGNVVPVWPKYESKYPIRVHVPMDNGHVIDYRIEKEKQESVLKPLLDTFDRVCFGRPIKKKPMPLTEGTSSRG